MKLIEAIALSPGNKAEARNDDGKLVVVQERYRSSTDSWYHIWHFTHPSMQERDIVDLQRLSAFQVNAEEKYWESI